MGPSRLARGPRGAGQLFLDGGGGNRIALRAKRQTVGDGTGGENKSVPGNLTRGGTFKLGLGRDSDPAKHPPGPGCGGETTAPQKKKNWPSSPTGRQALWGEVLQTRRQKTGLWPPPPPRGSRQKNQAGGGGRGAGRGGRGRGRGRGGKGGRHQGRRSRSKGQLPRSTAEGGPETNAGGTSPSVVPEPSAGEGRCCCLPMGGAGRWDKPRPTAPKACLAACPGGGNTGQGHLRFFFAIWRSMGEARPRCLKKQKNSGVTKTSFNRGRFLNRPQTVTVPGGVPAGVFLQGRRRGDRKPWGVFARFGPPPPPPSEGKQKL